MAHLIGDDDELADEPMMGQTSACGVPQRTGERREVSLHCRRVDILKQQLGSNATPSNEKGKSPAKKHEQVRVSWERIWKGP